MRSADRDPIRFRLPEPAGRLQKPALLKDLPDQRDAERKIPGPFRRNGQSGTETGKILLLDCGQIGVRDPAEGAAPPSQYLFSVEIKTTQTAS